MKPNRPSIFVVLLALCVAAYIMAAPAEHPAPTQTNPPIAVVKADANGAPVWTEHLLTLGEIETTAAGKALIKERDDAKKRAETAEAKIPQLEVQVRGLTFQRDQLAKQLLDTQLQQTFAPPAAPAPVPHP